MTVNSEDKTVCFQSAWAMDAETFFVTGIVAPSSYCPGELVCSQHTPTCRWPGDPGELQNEYTTVHSNNWRQIEYGIYFPVPPFAVASETAPWPWHGTWLADPAGNNGLHSPGAGALYARRHTMPSIHSFTTPSGVELDTVYGQGITLLDRLWDSMNPNPIIWGEYLTASYPLGAPQLYGGVALWEADVLANCQGNYPLLYTNSAGQPSARISSPTPPSYTAYQDFNERLRLKNNDYSVLPEFRISKFMEYYIVTASGDFLALNPSEFEIGGITGSHRSPSGFYGLDGVRMVIPGADNEVEYPKSYEIRDSSQDYFYKVFSNSDFMKQYGRIQKDHKDFVDPTTITLTCKGLLKLLPYNGFYPAERTLQIARLMSQSMSDNIQVFLEDVGSQPELSASSTGVPGLRFLKRPIFSTLFAPGVLYNSIKAGMAVDYPIYTGSFDIVQYGLQQFSPESPLPDIPTSIFALGTSSAGTTSHFDYRIPFEALLDPNSYLKDITIMDMEAHPDASYNFGYYAPYPQASNPAEYWKTLQNKFNGGLKNSLYQRAINNFLSEVPQFFLEDEEFTTISSAPQHHFKSVISGTYYAMRVKMRRTMTKPRIWETVFLEHDNEPILDFEIPQDPIVYNGMCRPIFSTANPVYATGGFGENLTRENFTLYSRPSAFGPPVAATGSLSQGWVSSASAGLLGSGTLLGNGWKVGSRITDSTTGFYCPFTPAYKDGEGWADIVFKAPRSGRPTLDEINTNCMVMLWRIDSLESKHALGASAYFTSGGQDADNAAGNRNLYFGTTWQNGIWCGGKGALLGIEGHYPLDMRLANANSMQIDASINLFGFHNNKWHIQPKFETPHYNFNDIRSGVDWEATATIFSEVFSSSYNNPPYNTVTIPVNASESVPRGMWHQFGKIESEKGVYLEVDDIPLSWFNGRGTTLPGPDIPAVINNEWTPGLRRYGVPYQQGTCGPWYPAAYYGCTTGAYFEHNDKNFPESLADICDFKASIKMGNSAKAKTISEAVVAVPFMVVDGKRNFFRIPENIIRLALGDLGESTAAGEATSAAAAAAQAVNNALSGMVEDDTINEQDQAGRNS